MFSLQRFFSKSDKFFGLLEASAEEARQSVQSLIQLLNSIEENRILDDMVLTRRKEKRITEEISAQICKTFVTPLEREEIEALSSALYKIPKTVEKFSERMLVMNQRLKKDDFLQQARLLEMAVDTVCQMVKQLRHKPHLERIKEQNNRLQHLEGEADKLVLELLRELYSGKHDPLRVMVMQNLYELLEKVIDKCRDAGNVVFHIVLKHS